MPDHKMYTLLYVDDEPALLDLGKIFLELTGEFIVQIASSVQEGIEALRIQPYDAVVSDYQMPEVDGIVFLKQVRLLFGDVPFILFTGKGREEVVIEAIKNGADFYLQKGGEPRPQFSELTNQIRQAIRRRRAEASLRTSEERFRGMAERSSDLILTCDPDLKMTYVSPSATTILGFEPDELIGVQAKSAMFLSTDFEKALEAVAKRPDHTLTGFEVGMRKKDGSWVVLSMRGSAIISEGTYVGVQVQGRDITEQKRVEDALARSESRLRALFSAMTDLILTLDIDGRYLEHAPTSPNQLHRIPDEFIGRTVYEIFPDAVAGQVLHGIRQTLSTGRTTPLEYSLIIEDAWHWFTALLSPLSDTTVLFVARDVTDQKDAEEKLKAAYEEIAASEEEIRQQYDTLTLNEIALRASEEAYRTIFEHTGTAMVQVGSDQNISLVNSTFETLTGYSRQELEGKRQLTDFVVPGDRPRVMALHKETSSVPGQPTQYEFRLIHQDGGERSILSTVGVLPQKGHAVASLVDITAIRHLEEELRVSGERFRMLFEHAPVAYHSLDPEGRLMAVNQAWLNEMGYTREEVIGRLFSELVVESNREHFKRLFSRLAECGHIRGNDYQLVRRDGTHFTALCELTVAYNQDKGLKQVHCMIINRSERMRVEQALRQANQQLNLMTSVTRHDIINKIMAIQAYLDLLSEEVGTGKEGTEAIIAKLNAATVAIKNQIEFTRIYRDLGYHPPRWQPMIELLPTDLPENVSLSAEVDGIEVYADQLLPKVFFNLLDNSLRHGERVSAIHLSADRHGEDLILSWEDDGVGVDAMDKERIFERGVGKNTGIGLFLVREILAITGITITEAGTPGAGARFQVTIPKGLFRSTGTE